MQKRQNTVIVRLFTARRTEQQAPGSGGRRWRMEGRPALTLDGEDGATRCAHGNQPKPQATATAMAHGLMHGLLFCLAGEGRRYSRRCATFRPAETLYRGLSLSGWTNARAAKLGS